MNPRPRHAQSENLPLDQDACTKTHAKGTPRKVALRCLARIFSSGLCLVARYGRYFLSAGLSCQISYFYLSHILHIFIFLQFLDTIGEMIINEFTKLSIVRPIIALPTSSASPMIDIVGFLLRSKLVRVDHLALWA